MITWFDALLVTLWAVLTALGARRGLAGLAWGVGAWRRAFWPTPWWVARPPPCLRPFLAWGLRS
ncbi:hypothetical protein [Deinococcus multiflagellatus]|uniref:Colicin V production protein n=1 Tax=Deinococcus multiflagellatus TaxID=1656887 RepID=A0ABW1ZP89_9DEIO